jgi:nucleotide-binding universal stress UspA family protein
METDLLQAREPGPAIIDLTLERGADLILMGIDYKTRFGQYDMGDVVPYVLKNAPCRVILYHQYLENQVQ